MHSAFGYKDNLLWSDVNRARSAFETAGVDLTVFRLPVDGPEIDLIVTGEDTRYFQSEAVEKEQFLVALGQIKHTLNPDWQLSLKTEYTFQDRVFDVSETVQNLSTLPMRGHGFALYAGARRSLPRQFWIESELSGARQYFYSLPDDHWAGAGKLTLGRATSGNSEMTLSYELRYMQFDDDTLQATALGAPVPGAPLEFLKHRVEFNWKQTWDERKRWRSKTRAEFLANTDNGSGYFDYLKFQVAQQLRYVTKRWELQARCSFNHYSYPVQTVSATDLRHRDRDELVAGVRIEHQLIKHCKLFTEYQYERQISNRLVETFHGNTVSLGFEWEL